MTLIISTAALAIIRDALAFDIDRTTALIDVLTRIDPAHPAIATHKVRLDGLRAVWEDTFE